MSSPVGKEHYEGAGALNKYLCDHMTPISGHMARLHEYTLQDKHNRMLSASDEMNFLQMLVKILGAKKTLDIGVYTGYSSLAVALALPDDGKVIACDVTDKWVNQCGRGVWRDAGIERKIDLRIAPALDTLQVEYLLSEKKSTITSAEILGLFHKFADDNKHKSLVFTDGSKHEAKALIDAGEAGTFDFAFIDADKENYLPYYEACLRLLRVGGLIAVDNALWGAKVLQDVVKMDPSTRAIHNLNVKVAGDARVHSSLLNIGDGLMLCRRLV